jgi:cell division protein FtsB
MRTKDAILQELAIEQAKLVALEHTREKARAKIESLRSEPDSGDREVA